MLGYHGFQNASRNMAGEAAVVRAEEKADRAQSQLARLKAKSAQATEMVVSKALVAGTAGGLGFWQGYKGEMPELLGVGADLWIGAGASLVALFGDELGIDDKYVGYIDAVGTGALAYWAANQGNMYGVSKAERDTPDMYPGEQKGGFPSTKGMNGGDPRDFAPHTDQSQQQSNVPYGYR